MKKSMKFATALAGAAVVVAGGTAFTDSNTVPASQAGYGQNEVTGITVSRVAYETNADNEITKAIFETSATLTGLDFQATLYSGDEEPYTSEASTISCVAGQIDDEPVLNKVTCTFAAPEATVAEVTQAGLAVWNKTSVAS